MPAIEIGGGALVMMVGVLIFLDEFTIFNSYFGGGAEAVTSSEERLAGIDITGPVGFLAAFVAGVIASCRRAAYPLSPRIWAILPGLQVRQGKPAAIAD
jgi:hypothetical protein